MSKPNYLNPEDQEWQRRKEQPVNGSRVPDQHDLDHWTPHGDGGQAAAAAAREADHFLYRPVGAPAPFAAAPTFGPNSMASRLKKLPPMRTPIIDGYLRRSEIMNLIAATKVGKTYLALDMAMAVVTGSRWFGYQTTKGNVFYLDNECHQETTDNRIAAITEARGYSPEELGGLYVKNLRGKTYDVEDIPQILGEINRMNKVQGDVTLCVLDAWYRFRTGEDADENSNTDTARAYNELDGFAQRCNIAFALVHHSPKGNQALKATTDGGAGAGAQSRAADTHLLIRPHEEQGCACVHAETRSWRRPNPFVVRWNYPLWTVEDLLNPADLEMPRTTRKRERAPAAQPEPVKNWTPEEFAKEFLTNEPTSKDALILAAVSKGIVNRTAERLVKAVTGDTKLAHTWRDSGDKRRLLYANIPQPTILTTESDEPTKQGKTTKPKRKKAS